MLHTRIHKDVVNSYQEKVVAGLSTRRLIACGIAFPLGIALSFILTTCWQLDVNTTGTIVVLVTIPIWYLGFMRPHDMDPEKFAELWYNDRFITQKLHYRTHAAELMDLVMAERQEKEPANAKKETRKQRKRREREPEWREHPASKRELKLHRTLWEKRKAIERAEAGKIQYGALQAAAQGQRTSPETGDQGSEHKEQGA